MTDEIRLSAVTLDCPDALGLAQFYADITGGTLTHAGDGWACGCSIAPRGASPSRPTAPPTTSARCAC